MRVAPKKIFSFKEKLIHINNDLDELYTHYHEWFRFGNLAEFEMYVVILEDRRYFSHSGIDYKSILREIYRIFTFQRNGGASTIEMQFVRTVNNRKERTLRRKAKEMLLSWLANYHFNKIALLRSYLSIAFFGSNLLGCDEASNKVFGRNSQNLQGYEAAFLAAMLVYPKPMTSTEAWEKKVDRRAKYALRLASHLKERFEKVGAGKIVEI